MTPRHAIACRGCGARLGRLNEPVHRSGVLAGQRQPYARVVTVEAGVRLFLDLAFRRVELHCPACGACGRTLDAGKFRGVVQVGEGRAA